MGKVRIFCDCGKEIWDDPDAVVRLGTYALAQIEREAICSDCLMAHALRLTGQPPA